MRSAAIALLLLAGTAFPLVVGYHLDPVKSSWSGWTPSEFPNNYVSEIITTNFDSLTDPAYIECFVGDGNPAGYKVEVLTYPGQDPVASGESSAVREHSWVRFSNLTVTHPELIVKGRQLEVRFSRVSGSDSLMYYYQDSASGGPYKYGQMIVGGPRTAA